MNCHKLESVNFSNFLIFQKERLLKERQEAFKNEIETMSGVLKAQLDAANKKYEGDFPLLHLIDLSLVFFFLTFYFRQCPNFIFLLKPSPFFYRFTCRHADARFEQNRWNGFGETPWS